MNNSLTKIEREWLALVKQVACSCCDKPPISEAHHTKQGNQFSAAALCYDCHRGPLGWDGDRTLMRIYKKDENDLISITTGRVYRMVRKSR